jgi:hypothetical protein
MNNKEPLTEADHCGTTGRKGEYYAVDDLRDSYDHVAFGISQRVYDRRFHSYPAGHRDRCSVDKNYSRAKPSVNLIREIMEQLSIEEHRENLD